MRFPLLAWPLISTHKISTCSLLFSKDSSVQSIHFFLTERSTPSAFLPSLSLLNNLQLSVSMIQLCDSSHQFSVTVIIANHSFIATQCFTFPPACYLCYNHWYRGTLAEDALLSFRHFTSVSLLVPNTFH